MLYSRRNVSCEQRKYEYEMFMKAINLEIPFSELHKVFHYGEKSGQDMKLIDDFIFYYRGYNTNIDGMFNIYVMDKPLFKKSFDTYMDFINKKISLYEYLEQVEQLDLDKVSYINVVFEYADKIKQVPQNEITKMREKGFFSRNVLEYLLNTSDEKEIFDILTVYGQYKSRGLSYGNNQLNNLMGLIFDFVIVKYRNNINDNERDEIISSLKKKIYNVYKKYYEMKQEEFLNKKTKEKTEYLNEILEQSINLINNYMDSNLYLKQYLEKTKIPKKDFDKSLESIQKNKPELYQQYEKYNKKLQSEKFAVLSNKCDIIIERMKNGVINEETNEKRDFDILDYYMYTNLTPEEFVNIIKEKCNSNDMRIIKTFFTKNKGKKDETKIIREMKYSINSVEITDEQKEKIIDYLKSINAPVNIRTFKLAVKRYLNNELINEKGKTR